MEMRRAREGRKEQKQIEQPCAGCRTPPRARLQARSPPPTGAHCECLAAVTRFQIDSIRIVIKAISLCVNG